MPKYCVAVCCLLCASISVANADDEFFENRIRPILVEHCYACHNSSETMEGELAIDHRQGFLEGGSGGTLIVPGDPAKSRLIAILKHEIEGLEMPEDGPKLSSQIVADFEKWITDGARDPRDEPPSADEITQVTSWDATLERRKNWWSFQPVESPELPPGKGNPIDRFVRAKLKQVGLSAADRASPAILIRRLYYTLTGLPPTPEELDQWRSRFAAAETNPSNVTTDLIDHLLSSKQYGPRWARHWMDWIRYAESHGSEGDPAMKNAWMYRDYLIRALNDDIPYDQLVREHLAGDLMTNPRINEELGLNESLLATIQLRMVFHGFSPTDALDEKVRFVDDQVNTISKAFLGLTVSCARCHDHKFDAISQADYYAMFGMFAACRPGRSIADTPDRLYKNRDALAELKPKIREAISEQWLRSIPTIAERIKGKLNGDVPENSLLATVKSWIESTEKTSSMSDAWQTWVEKAQQSKDKQSDVIRSWDFSKPSEFQQWIRSGIAAGANQAGQFAVELSGENAIQGIYPGGVYSHLLSTKHPLRISSPDVPLDGKYDYWVRAIGDLDAATRYVAQDYPRTGTVFQASKLKPAWTWHKLKLDYWEGDSVHFELATGPDIPLQASDKPRSWFGVSDVRVVKHDAPMPDNRIDFATAIIAVAQQTPKTTDQVIQTISDALDAAIQGWRSGACTDSQADLIDHALRTGLLDNKLESLATAKPLIETYRRLEAEVPQPRRVPGLDDVPQRQQPLFIRGNHKQPGDVVMRRFLEAIDTQTYPLNETGRARFAEDILRTDNPLSRRVIVNRIWHHMFGVGIIATPDNLGRLGRKPTHPKLLDWLAVRFVQDGWSLKKLIRLIATSETWQQSSEPSSRSLELDPDNQYLSHANVRRLEAEAIRDAMLRASGDIDSTVQSGPVDANSNLRSVFMRVRRNSLDPMLRAFDFPEPHSAVGRRDATNVPAQSLLLMNSPQVKRFANRLAKEIYEDSPANSDQERMARMYLRLFSRPPNENETKALVAHLESTSQALQERRAQVEQLKSEIGDRQLQIVSIIEPKRQELEDQAPSETKPTIIQPIGQWEFEQEATDGIGSLNGTIIDGAKIATGKLVVSSGGHVNSTPLQSPLKAKTMEAWVQLDNLDQRGGGVMTVQTLDGRVFDSIVFAERQVRRWLAGSDGFSRTQDFTGSEEEKEAANRLVHVAIAYHGDGTVVGYRDGKRYGEVFKTKPPIEYKAGKAIVSFGVRHLPNIGNRRLAGQLERANLYDRALSDDEVLESFQHWSGRISDQRVMEALSASERASIEVESGKIAELQQQIAALGPIPENNNQYHAWTDLVRAMFMLKEFIYVR